MDRRQARTRQAIIDAFVNLLDKSSYEKISVKEIIDTANVGRSTFYSHFETKDDLACQICNNLFEHIFSHVIPPCSTHNFSEVEPSAETRITHILYHLRDKRKYYIGIIKHEDALVKVLGDGELTKALTVSVDKVSASAKAKIEAAGGKVEEPC